ncbi:MAG: SAM-dependent chlorinase/fluorinase [Pseudomonadota bacterium]
MIVTFTDFGGDGPYLGQLKAVFAREAPGQPVIDLFSNAPRYNPRAAAYLLAAYVDEFADDAVFLAVVDPGVGDPARRPAAVQVDGRWFVGPDNGLFNVVAARGAEVAWWDIEWRPARLSASFHGRDLFAPVAARLARGEPPPGLRRELAERLRPDWPAELAEIIYIDHFGNAMTGTRAASLGDAVRVQVRGASIGRARTYSAVPLGAAFWYENANGLVEIAINQGRADQALALAVGDRIAFSADE